MRIKVTNKKTYQPPPLKNELEDMEEDWNEVDVESVVKDYRVREDED